MSYYVTDTAQLFIMPDIAEVQDHQLIERGMSETHAHVFY